jgi:hypothetical protein
MVNELRILEEGRITAVNEESRTYTVNTSHYSVSEVPYVKDTGVLKSSGDEILSIWDRVLLYQSESRPMILFKVPEGNVDSIPHPPVSYSNVTPVSEAMTENNRSNISYRTGGAFDVLQGDFVKYGPDGGVISILRGPVVKLGASSLSQIQFHKMDDLIRTVARNTDTFTDFGEKRVYNDEGEVNVEIYGASQQFETMGADRPGEEIGKHTEETGYPRYRTDTYDRMGKWRIHAFAGWLGDNLRLFVTRRGDSNKRLEAKSPVGLAEIIVSHDGAIRVRSAREVVLEKVSRIRVPKKIREPHHNDKGDTAQRDGGYAPTPHKFYQWDQTHKAGRQLQYPEWHNHYVDHEEVRHFRDHKKDWYVESETKAALARKAKDIWEGKEEEKFEETSACFKLGNDGSIYAEDTWGSIFSMTNEDIVISARRDVKIQAGRDLQIFGTREGTIRTQKDLDVVSHEGTVRVKANEDLLMAADSGNASLDSGQGNVNINSRQKDVLIRAERESIVMKADLKDIRAVSVEGEINLRSKLDLQLASDTAQAMMHGSSRAQVTSGSAVLIATGTESPSLGMTGTQRNNGRFTDTTDSQDSNNSVSLTNLDAYLDLGNATARLHSKAETLIDSDSAIRNFVEGAKLEIAKGSYTLSSTGGGTIVRGGNQEITRLDDDSEVNGRNKTWNTGASHGDITVVDVNAAGLSMTEADIQRDAFAEGRFRYKDGPNRGDLIKNYNYPWNNEGEKVNLTKDLAPWSSLIPTDSQEIPDIGVTRPIKGDTQLAIEEEDVEQVAPYSNYVKFNDGTYSFDDKVTPGGFENVDQVSVPTSWEENPTSVGRLNLIPAEAEGKSGGDDLARSEFEDVINSDINFKQGD